MEWQQFIINIFEQISNELEHTLDGLTVEEMNQQPSPGGNSIGWLAWHLTRSHDRNMSEIAGEEQLWISDKWHARFNRLPDPAETGFGHNAQDAATFRSPDGRVILDYHRAVVARIKNYINSRLSEAELDRDTYSPTLNMTAPVSRRLLGVINDAYQHLGQAAYARGLIKGWGWLGR
jgi:hypothetical protein